MNYKIIDVTPDNITSTGIFCASKDKYEACVDSKVEWYKLRYQEGLRMKVIVNEEGLTTGMIEYVPSEYAWRNIDANNYTIIHCLQISRIHTKKGYGLALLTACIGDSKDSDGIAIVTSSKPWVNDKKFFIKQGFKKVDQAEPYYELLAKPFHETTVLPRFHNEWRANPMSFEKGVTVYYSYQCPMVVEALKCITEAANECNLNIHLHLIDNAMEAQNVPFAYGTLGIFLDGKFITHRIFDKDRYVAILKSGTTI